MTTRQSDIANTATHIEKNVRIFASSPFFCTYSPSATPFTPSWPSSRLFIRSESTTPACGRQTYAFRSHSLSLRTHRLFVEGIPHCLSTCFSNNMLVKVLVSRQIVFGRSFDSTLGPVDDCVHGFFACFQGHNHRVLHRISICDRAMLNE